MKQIAVKSFGNKRESSNKGPETLNNSAYLIDLGFNSMEFDSKVNNYLSGKDQPNKERVGKAINSLSNLSNLCQNEFSRRLHESDAEYHETKGHMESRNPSHQFASNG